MPRQADVPHQDDDDDVIPPPERLAFYPGLPRIRGGALLGEVIDIHGYRGPFDSKPQYQKPDATKKKQYIIARARVHGPVAVDKSADADLKATASSLKCGLFITTSISSIRVMSKLSQVGRKPTDDPETDPQETLLHPVRGQLVKAKTEAGFEVRDLVAAPDDWECPTCGAKAKVHSED